MEDLPIEPGICATRIRCYTEGAIQRPPKLKARRSVSGTLYKSVSSVQLTKNANIERMPSLTSQHELCKSCDQLQGRVNRLSKRTFVSSMNIALVKPQPPRKISLPDAPVFYQRGDKLKSYAESSNSSSSQVDSGNSLSVSNIAEDQQMDGISTDASWKTLDEMNTFNINPHEGQLPWEISDEFPHIPVLERIRQFEKQTTPNSRSSSPGRWKLKGKTNLKKGSVHSSPAMSRKNSIDENVVVKNSRNSLPTILHSNLLKLDLNSRTFSEVCIIKGSTDSPRSDIRNSDGQNVVSSPQVNSCTTEALSKSEGVKVDCVWESRVATQDDVADKAPSGSNADSMTVERLINSLPPKNQERHSSIEISQTAHPVQERASPEREKRKGSEQHPMENNSIESSLNELVDPDKTSCNSDCSCPLSKDHTKCDSSEGNTIDCSMNAESSDTMSECVHSDLSSVTTSCLQENSFIGQNFRDQETSALGSAFVLEPLCDNSSDSNSEQADNKVETEALELSVTTGDFLLGSSPDCPPQKGPVQSSALSTGSKSLKDAIPAAQGVSSEKEIIDVQCNRPDLPECVTTPMTENCQSGINLNNSDPIQPLIGEILQASISVDTDIYSQRCSQQLGESGVLHNASLIDGLATRLLTEGCSPCLSDCYSSSSDEESQIASGITFSNLNQSAEIKTSLNLSEAIHGTDYSTGSSITPSSSPSKENLPEVGIDTEAMQETKPEKKEITPPLSGAHNLKSSSSTEFLMPLHEETEESRDTGSNRDTDDSLSVSSASELSDSSDFIPEVLKSNPVSNLSSSLGACGGLPTSDVPSLHAIPLGLSRDKIAFSRHLSALIDEQHNRGAGEGDDQRLNVDQALFLSRVNLLLDWIRRQPPSPVAASSQKPMPSVSTDRRSEEVFVPGNIQGASTNVSNTNQTTVSPIPDDSTPSKERSPQAVQQNETEVSLLKPNKRPRQKKYVDPDKVSHLRYLILQSPIVLWDGEDSDSDESDVELNEFGEVKQDYPLGRLPDYIVAQIFRNLPTKDLAALKCACKDFKWLIEKFDIKSSDSKWAEESLYREDPCMQCGKIRDPRGDVSLCRWHPKIYYKNGEIGRHYWTCCFASEEDSPGCTTSLHDNKWSGSHSRLCKVPRSWRQYWRSYPMDS